MAAKDALGRRGEEIAARHLIAKGLTIIERNWRCARGEIDIIAREGDVLVFAEVKTRSSTRYGHPLEAITAVKLGRLRQLAALWCEAHPGHWRRIRIDAVAVLAPRDASVTVEHLVGVF